MYFSKNLTTCTSPVPVCVPEESISSDAVLTRVGAMPPSHRFQPAPHTDDHSRVRGEQNTSQSKNIAFKLRLRLLELEMIFGTCFPTP